MQTPDLHLELRPTARMAPWTLQALHLLELGTADLSDFVEAALLENPLLEREEHPFESTYAATGVHYEDGPLPEPAGEEGDRLDTLPAILLEQLEARALPKPLEALCAYMVELLDDDGYLQEEDLRHLTEVGVPDGLLRQALETLHDLEPAGVGATSLGQCLLLQLRRRGQDTPLLEQLLAGHLEDLGRQAYGRIARQLGISEEVLLVQCAILRELEPRPGAAYTDRGGRAAPCILPDFLVEEENGVLTIRVHPGHSPQLHLSGPYEQMLRDTQDEEVRAYLTERHRRAQWLIDCISRRMDTLERCGQELLRVQYGFFDGSESEPLPATMAALAAAVGVAPSTVTRALKGKYLQCRRGVFPVSCFFARPVSGGDLGRRQIQGAIHRLVEGEDKARPYRDQQLTDLLLAQGISVTRRTVTKYRQQMGLPTASDRRIAAAVPRKNR